MIITLVKADFSANNIGMIDAWMINRALGTGASYIGPNTITKGGALNATISLANGYYAVEDEVVITMGGTDIGSAFSFGDSEIIINIPEVTGNIVIYVPTVSVEGDIDKIVNQWITITPALEVGTTSDDATGTMGNKVNNSKRLRTAEAIECDILNITAPVGMYLWYNIFDEDGKLVTTSGTSLAFTNSTGEGLAYRTIPVKSAGGHFIWPIFKGNSDGNIVITDEMKAQITFEMMNLGETSIAWESGTFSDSTGEKVANAGRLRTPNKIEVPAAAKGIRFLPTGTFDLWIKTYDTADQLKPTMNGIKGSEYWNTRNDGVSELTWAQIVSNSQRPAYVDYVLKASASQLSPGDAANVVVEFIM